MGSVSSGPVAIGAEQSRVGRRSAGVVGGLAAGMVFGMLMQMMGMMPMVAMLVGSDSMAVGWLVHLAISALFGVVYAVLLGSRAGSRAMTLVLGAVFGMVLWLVGPLLLMPAKLGMPLLQVDATALQSLMGHVIYGVVLGLTTAWWSARTERR